MSRTATAAAPSRPPSGFVTFPDLPGIRLEPAPGGWAVQRLKVSGASVSWVTIGVFGSMAWATAAAYHEGGDDGKASALGFGSFWLDD